MLARGSNASTRIHVINMIMCSLQNRMGEGGDWKSGQEHEPFYWSCELGPVC